MNNKKQGFLLAAQLEEPGGIAGLDENGLVRKHRLPSINIPQVTLASLNGETKGAAAELVNDETVIRKQEDTKLQQQIALELAIREREDTKLQQQITAIISTKLVPILPAWQNLTLLSGWASNSPAQFILLNGIVLVTGILVKPNKAVIDEIIAILPVGYRPRQIQKFLSQGLSASSRPCFEVGINGEIKYQNIGNIPHATNGLTLSSIIFVPGG